MRRKLAAGNWKMNGASADLSEIRDLIGLPAPQNTDILVCPIRRPMPTMPRCWCWASTPRPMCCSRC